MSTSKRIVLTSCLVVALGAAAGGSAGADRTHRHDFEAAALAIPNVAGGHDRAVEMSFDSARARDVRIGGVATTSLTCDRCSGQAISLQVIYLRPGTTFVARNAAIAWAADCTDCSGSALSVQVVVARSAGGVTVANRALAINAGCVLCRTTATAVQVVVVGAAARTLSGPAVARIQALRDQLVAQLRGATASAPVQGRSTTRTGAGAGSTPNALVTAATARLQDVLTTDLAATSASHSIRVRSSG